MGEKPEQPGPVYDNAMRKLVEGDAERACELLQIPLEGIPEILPASLPRATVTLDLLLRTAPDRLAHVEYEREGGSDIVRRMLLYRSLISRRYTGDRLSQYVVVLGDRRVTGHDDLQANGFALRLHVIYLRELEAERFLGHPSSAPLAVLARGTPDERQEAFARALALIVARGGPRAGELFDAAVTLATIRLEETMIGEISEEAAMRFKHPGAYAIRHTALADDLREMEREELFLNLLHDRFGEGPHIAEAAHALATWGDKHAALRSAMSATSIDDVLPHRGS